MTSPLRPASDQTMIDELADAVISMRLDLEELRATTEAHRSRNLEFVAETADQFALLLMSLTPLQRPLEVGAHGSRLSGGTSSPVRAGSRTVANPAAAVARFLPHASPSRTPRQADGGGAASSSAAAAGGAARNAAESVQVRRTNASPEPLRRDDVDDNERSHRSHDAVMLPITQLRQSSPQQATPMPPLTARRLIVPSLGAHTVFASAGTAQRITDERRARAEAAAADVANNSPPPAPAVPEATPLRNPPVPPPGSAPSTLAGTLSSRRSNRPALSLACTTFGGRFATGRALTSRDGQDIDPESTIATGEDGSWARKSPPRTSRGAKRRTGRAKLVDPTDPSVSDAGREDQRLLSELAARAPAVPGTPRRGDEAPRPGTQQSQQPRATAGPAPSAEAWVLPSGINYREPFVADRSKLAIEPLPPGNYDAQGRYSPLAGSSNGEAAAAVGTDAEVRALTAAGRDVLVAVPGRSSPAHAARHGDRAFQPAFARRARAGGRVAAEDLAFSSKTPRETVKPPAAIKRPSEVPKLQLVMTKLQ